MRCDCASVLRARPQCRQPGSRGRSGGGGGAAELLAEASDEREAGREGEFVAEKLAVDVFEREARRERLGVGVGVGVGVAVGEAPCVSEGDGDEVALYWRHVVQLAVADCVGVLEGVLVCEGVSVPVGVGVPDGVGEAVSVPVLVMLAVREKLVLGVRVWDGVCVGVFAKAQTSERAARRAYGHTEVCVRRPEHENPRPERTATCGASAMWWRSSGS